MHLTTLTDNLHVIRGCSASSNTPAAFSCLRRVVRITVSAKQCFTVVQISHLQLVIYQMKMDEHDFSHLLINDVIIFYFAFR